MIASVQPQVPQTLYEQTFRNHLQSLLTTSPDWLQDRRLQALSRFEVLGFPTRHQEAWKYINIRPLLSQAFQPHIEVATVSLNELRPHCLMQDEDTIRLVFVNGRYSATLSTQPESLQGIIIDSFKNACENHAQTIQEFSNELAQESDAFTALNMALFEDGVFLKVADQVHLESLVQILFVTTPSFEPRAAYLRNLFLIGKQAKINCSIEYVGLGNAPYFNNSIQEFRIAEGGQVDCSIIFNEAPQGWHFSATRNHLESNAQLSLSNVTLGGQVTRNAISSLLKGEQAEVHLNGLDVLCDQTEIYHHTVTEHWMPNCVSTQYYKGILDDDSKSEFNGMVFVAEGANGTDSQQLNKNLLLSDTARVWTRPQLQINADDVKCAHGATVGQLEKDQLFYLASRGLDRDLAQGLLTYGFAEEIIQKIASPQVRHYLDAKVLNNLHRTDAVIRQLGV
jgi:Fe-S cluster assembly protein SufD